MPTNIIRAILLFLALSAVAVLFTMVLMVFLNPARANAHIMVGECRAEVKNRLAGRPELVVVCPEPDTTPDTTPVRQPGLVDTGSPLAPLTSLRPVARPTN